MQNVIKADQYLYDTTVGKKKNFISFKANKKMGNCFSCNVNLVGNPTKRN